MIVQRTYASNIQKTILINYTNHFPQRNLNFYTHSSPPFACIVNRAFISYIKFPQASSMVS